MLVPEQGSVFAAVDELCPGRPMTPGTIQISHAESRTVVPPFLLVE